MRRCGWTFTIFALSSRSNPLITASTMISAMTPMATPPTEIMEIREIKPVFFRWVRCLPAIKPSNAMVFGLRSFFGLQLRKQNHFPDRRLAGQEHHQPVDADPEAA